MVRICFNIISFIDILKDFNKNMIGKVVKLIALAMVASGATGMTIYNNPF